MARSLRAASGRRAKDSISFQSTSEALRTFRAFGLTPQVAAAHQFLDAEPFLNTEHLARGLVAAAQAGDPSPERLDRLATHQGLAASSAAQGPRW